LSSRAASAGPAWPAPITIASKRSLIATSVFAPYAIFDVPLVSSRGKLNA
jgi:hypothetical protein